MRNVLAEMIEIYKPDGVDWMGYKMTKENPYTFHHIKERRKGGKFEVDNGAILTFTAHEELNYYDLYCKGAYEAYQRLFRIINDRKRPLTPDLYKEIERLSYRVKVLHEFAFREESDRAKLRKQERQQEKKLIKQILDSYPTE